MDLFKNSLGTIELYNTCYNKDDAPWHRNEVNLNLIKFYDALFPIGRAPTKVLVPLCGKTVDIKYLADLGHTVVGVEFCEKPAREIFEREQIKYTEQELPEVKGKVFESLDGKMKVYCCDFYKFSARYEGLFDSVWESGAQVDYDNRIRFYEQMKMLTSPGCRWLTALTSYDINTWLGMPFSVPHSQVVENLEKDFEIISLERKYFDRRNANKVENDNEEQQMMHGFMRARNLQWCEDHVYLFLKKSN